MFRPIYKLSSPYLSLSLSLSLTVLPSLSQFYFFTLSFSLYGASCTPKSEPQKKKNSSTKNSIAAFRVVHYPTRPKPLHRRSDPDFAPPKMPMTKSPPPSSSSSLQSFPIPLPDSRSNGHERRRFQMVSFKPQLFHVCM